ncbi:hypothetical protein GA0115260_150842, partial [Streptomyces sp. MnatMP-M27]
MLPTNPEVAPDKYMVHRYAIEALAGLHDYIE